MNTTTASFETGSEFRVDWSTYTVKQARRNGVMMNVSVSHEKSERFSTYEEAKSFIVELRGTQKKLSSVALMVRLPGNKRFTMDFNAKKAN